MKHLVFALALAAGSPPVADTPVGAQHAAPLLAPSVPLSLDRLPYRPEATIVRRAQELVVRGDPARALELVAPATSPAAALVRARAALALGRLEQAREALSAAAHDPVLVAYVALERGLVAQAEKSSAKVASELSPVLEAGRDVAQGAALALAQALAAVQPAQLIERYALIERALPADNLDAKSLLLGAKIQALRLLGHEEEARATELKRYLEEPVSLETPATAPPGAKLGAEDVLKRAYVLLEAHRNERVAEAVAELADTGLSRDQWCRKHFALGLSARKLHQYADAESELGKVAERCADLELVRRAQYLGTQVAFIRDSLRAVSAIEKFARRFSGSSMVDDVLFWAGDAFQRNGRDADAERYFRRIVDLRPADDYCAQASFRLGWLAYRRGDLAAARERLGQMAAGNGCPMEPSERAQAHYWLGRLALAAGSNDAASAAWREAWRLDPLGYYAQLALTRLRESAPEVARELAGALTRPSGAAPALCPGRLAHEPLFERALELLTRGLDADAARALKAISVPEQAVVASTQAASLGARVPDTPDDPCSEAASKLLFALALDRAGAHREAHWHLRTELAQNLSHFPRAQDGAVWRAAYPLAFRDRIEAAEKESSVPPLFLQALAREESALDPKVVSWAGAYGLTQLLLSTGRAAGKLVVPPVQIAKAEDLLDPAVNARLGGAMLGHLLRRFQGNPGLALAAYNASEDVARTWWKRFAGKPFDEFAEEMTIKETRGYVKRVLETYGIYRWLYGGESPVLPVSAELPALPHSTP